MNIIDVTELLKSAQNVDNYYVFNPSIVHLQDALYLISYRICHYDLSVQIPPWKVWNDGYKYFTAQEKKHIITYKCRDTFGPARRVPFQLPIVPKISPEYDSTGLAIVRLNAAGAHLVANNVAPFRDEMNQDARLTTMENGDIRISYNTINCDKQMLLRWRTLRVLLDEWMYEYDGEREMFESKKAVEKNCVFFRDKIIYSIGQTLGLLDARKNLMSIPCPIRTFPQSYISSSAPPVPYLASVGNGRGDTWLGVGHIKVEYTSKLVERFLSATNMKAIQPHTKYVYFMFFYELDNEGRMRRVSPPFVPTRFMSHLPHLLAMPTGLVGYGNQIIAAYGEGDCRCKLLFLTHSVVEKLLRDRWDGETFYYLSAKHAINHVGYYNAGNTGDECFKQVFLYLKNIYYPSSTITFYAPGDLIPEADLTVFGGGDVITSYFLNSLKGSNAIAVGVGIPYAEFEPELARFRRVFLRDKFDAAKLGVPWFPDLAFLLPKIWPVKEEPRPRVIGISVLQTYYNYHYEELYESYIQEMTSLVHQLVEDDFMVVLFPFGVNARKPGENDLIACMNIRRRLGYPDAVTILKPHDVEKVYRKVAQMEFMICARFHSHIFAAALNVPFISLTLGRKCIQFMKMANLEENLFRLRSNHMDLPVDVNADAIYSFFRARYWYKNNIKARLKELNYEYARHMVNFEQEYVKAVADNVRGGQISLYPVNEGGECFQWKAEEEYEMSNFIV